MAYLGMGSPDVYTQAIRHGLAIYYTVDATLSGVPTATDLRPTGGSITDTVKPGVRRVLNLELAAEVGQSEGELFDALAPFGTMLTVTAHVRYTNRATVSIPMGVFDVDSETLSVGGGALRLTAPDKWVRIQRAKFILPQVSVPGLPVTGQIAALIRGALGADEPVNITSTSTVQVGILTFEKDRDKAILDLAESIGVWVYFDRAGVATIADIPTVGESADWLVDASASGVLTELDRERSRTDTVNVIAVSSSASEGELFPTQYAWDNDPASPTYAGVNPVTQPETASAFGIVVDYFDTPIARTAVEGHAAGRTILARKMGLVSQVSLGQVPNPAVDAFDVIDVLPPGVRPVKAGSATGGFGRLPFGTTPFGNSPAGAPVIRYVPTQVFERHIADTVTHPLSLGAAQHIEGRSTRLTELPA